MRKIKTKMKKSINFKAFNQQSMFLLAKYSCNNIHDTQGMFSLEWLHTFANGLNENQISAIIDVQQKQIHIFNWRSCHSM